MNQLEFIKKIVKDNQSVYLYKLNIKDAIVLHAENKGNIFVVLEGELLLSKVFSNNEKIGLNILSKHDVIQLDLSCFYNCNHYYQMEALSTAYILSLSKLVLNRTCLFYFYKYQYKTVIKSLYILEIVIHRKVKTRLIHLLLVIAQLFGQFYKDYVQIDLVLSYTHLAILIGSNKNTVALCLKDLQKQKLISYQFDHVIIYDPIQLSYL